MLDADVVIGALDAHHGAARALFATWHADGTPRLLSLGTLTEILIAPAATRARLSTAMCWRRRASSAAAWRRSTAGS